MARSFLGLSSSLDIISKGFDSWAVSSKSVEFNENKATSDPEIKAEHTNSKNNNIEPYKMEESIAKNEINKLMGSGSKLLGFS